MSYLMGIDIGSTETKCVVFNEEGGVVSEGRADTVLSYDKDNSTWSYWDPSQLWENTVSAIRQAVSGVEDPARIAAAAVTSIGCDIVPLDEKGNPLYYFKSWHCPRVQPQMDRWTTEVGAKNIFLDTGRQQAKMDTVYYLDWLAENKKDVLDRTKKVLLVSDYINFKLTGRVMTDYSMASTTSAFDLREKKWHSDYLRLANVTESIMPDIAPSATVIGNITKGAAEFTGLAENTLVVLGGHDNECAALSAGVMGDGDIVDIVGTWEIILASGTVPVLTEDEFSFGLSESVHVIKDRFATLGYEVSGYLLEWAKANLYGNKPASRNGWESIIGSLNGMSAGSRGVMVLPFMSGRSCICPNPLSSCTILGLKPFHDKSDIMHAVFEGMGFQTRELIEGMERAQNRTYSELVCVGGPTRNNLLMQIKADICGKRIKTMDLSHGTALGAAMIAGIGAGVYKDFRHSIDAIQKKQTYKMYAPNPENRDNYNAIFDRYKRAYQAVNSI